MVRNNLWAPWRLSYIQGIEKGGDCFLCHDLEHPEDDDKNLVLWRTERCLVVLNRFPYNNGHLLIAPNRHIGTLDEMTDEELLECTRLIREGQKVLQAVLNPHGFNVGMNIGRCSGAGLPGHLHIHIVPRWNGDTNFMAVCADTDVISQSMEELMTGLKEASREQNLPNLSSRASETE